MGLAYTNLPQNNKVSFNLYKFYLANLLVLIMSLKKMHLAIETQD